MATLVLPELGENIETAEVTAVLVAAGDRIAPEQPLIEVDTEKASIEVPATAGGRVAQVLVKPGDTIRVGQAIVVFEAVDSGAVTAPPPQPAPAPTAVAAPEPAPPQAPARPRAEATRPAPREAGFTASPAVRAMARDLGVDLGAVRGTGPSGRITREDVKAWVREARSTPASGAVAAARELPDFSRWGPVRREPLPAIRRATAAAMIRSWSEIPHVTQFDQADVTGLEQLRQDYNQGPGAEAGRLSMTAFAVKAAAAALRQFPKFNASLDLAASAAIFKERIHVAVAVDTERGLLVPVVRDADRKDLAGLAAEIDRLAMRAREGKLGPDEMSGATFTVSNLGGLGTTFFTPIVNWPEVAILGVGRAQTLPVWRGERPEPRSVLPLSVSYDHRWIDGAEAARFARWIARALERPLGVLLGVQGGGA